MKPLLLILSASLVVSLAGCRDRDADRGDRIEFGKPVAHDDDFIQTRSNFETRARERLDRLSERIQQLGGDASDELRVQRDALAKRLEGTDEQLESGWDRFASETTDALERLEQKLDHAID